MNKFRVGEMVILIGPSPYPEYHGSPAIVIELKAYRTMYDDRVGMTIRGIGYLLITWDDRDANVSEKNMRKLYDGGETQTTERGLELVG